MSLFGFLLVFPFNRTTSLQLILCSYYYCCCCCYSHPKHTMPPFLHYSCTVARVVRLLVFLAFLRCRIVPCSLLLSPDSAYLDTESVSDDGLGLPGHTISFVS